MTTTTGLAQAPSPFLMLLEGRKLYELAACYLAMPILRSTPQGDGHPVLVLPGFATDDKVTAFLRDFLKERGYAAHPWQLGRNLGPSDHLDDLLTQRLTELRSRYGRKVSLVGWSLGGVYARELARAHPNDVRQVITLGSPFTNNPKANHGWRFFEWLTGARLEDQIDATKLERMRQPPPVPSTSIYTRSDGMTAWQCCLERDGARSENIEIEGSHSGLVHNPLALYAIADRLAQTEGEWKPFERRGLKRALFPDPKRSGPLSS